MLPALCALGVTAQENIEYSAEALFNASSGELAPYFIGSLNHGVITRKNSALLDLQALVALNTARRFSWGAGIEVIAGYSASTRYERWNESTKSWGHNSNRPAPVWIQQLYVEGKYRAVQAYIGQRNHKSVLLDEHLSSGDLVRSSNARGIPGAGAGFIEFQNIPFTNGWLQINGVVEYGYYTDDRYTRQQFNYYNFMLAQDVWYTYKYCHFRTNPSKPFSVTFGMQHSGDFGGRTDNYTKGVFRSSTDRGFSLKSALKMFFPRRGTGSEYYEGNSLGSWDFKARYRLRNGDELSFAFEWPWEDGSGIGRQNGWDGLWGLYYKSSRRQIVNGAAFEYIDFTNQSGPIHWAAADRPGTTINNSATGGDSYYNNYAYPGFDNYGMSIGSPFLVSPLYNLNGVPVYMHDCARGFHAAVSGCIGPDVDYLVKYSWQQGWGMGRQPNAFCKLDHSMLFDVDYRADKILPGLALKAQVAFDAGRLRGNNFGAMIGVKYSGLFNFKKK